MNSFGVYLKRREGGILLLLFFFFVGGEAYFSAFKLLMSVELSVPLGWLVSHPSSSRTLENCSNWTRGKCWVGDTSSVFSSMSVNASH